MSDDAELKELIALCIKNPEHINTLSEELVDVVAKKITLYGNISYTPKNNYTCCSITNLRESYIKRLLTVSLVGYIYRSLEEYNGVADKTEIHKFLNSIFEFNPDYHVKKASNRSSTEQSGDKQSGDKQSGDKQSNDKQSSDKQSSDKQSDLVIDNTTLLHCQNIPADTFYRLDNYMAINYEFFREIVQNAYYERADFDYIINIYESFDNEEDAKKFVNKYQDQFIHDVYTIKNNNWTFLGPFKKNREKVDFYNDNTTHLKSILEQVESDQKLGKELMKKRVTNEKRYNIRTQGAHATDVGELMGNKDTIANDKEANDLSLDDNPYLRAYDNNTLRVDVFETDGVDLKKSHFMTESVKPTESEPHSTLKK